MSNYKESLIEQLKDAAHALPGFNDEMVRLSDAIAIVRQHDPHPTVWNWKNTNNGSLWGTPREHKPVMSGCVDEGCPHYGKAIKCEPKDGGCIATVPEQPDDWAYTIERAYVSGLAENAFDSFLEKASNAHTIDIHMRADGKDFYCQGDFLKHTKKSRPFLAQPPKREAVQGIAEEMQRQDRRQYPNASTTPSIDYYQTKAREAISLVTPYLATREPVSSAQQSLFKHGTFTSHSGLQLPDKIDCDALTDADWDAVSAWFASRLTFGQVVGIPQGGLALARALEKHVTTGPTLIVDDVLTTGRSMEEARKDHPGAIGAVLFSRTRNVPIWITARWVESDMADTRQPVGLTLNDSPEKQMPRGEIELILHSHHVSFCRRFKAEGKPKDAEWAMDEAEAVLLGRRPIERESGWQPIETVPDDVDRVLGYSASGGQDGSPCVADIKYEQGATTEGWWEAVDENRFWPTHWMPLPPNPTGIEGGKS